MPSCCASPSPRMIRPRFDDCATMTSVYITKSGLLKRTETDACGLVERVVVHRRSPAHRITSTGQALNDAICTTFTSDQTNWPNI